MQCTACHKTLATIHVLDLTDGEVVSEHALCKPCAEGAGYIHSPLQTKPLFSSEMLEDLVGTSSGWAADQPGQEAPQKDTSDSCPACGLSLSQFRARGRFGCPRCYEVFRRSLLPLLERVHDATSHRGRCPGKSAILCEPDNRVPELNTRLQEAIRAEDYELAAKIRDEIRQIETSEGAAD